MQQVGGWQNKASQLQTHWLSGPQRIQDSRTPRSVIPSGFHGKWIKSTLCILGTGPDHCSSQGLGTGLFSTLPFSETGSFEAGWMKWKEAFGEGNVRTQRLLSHGGAAQGGTSECYE